MHSFSLTVTGSLCLRPADLSPTRTVQRVQSSSGRNRPRARHCRHAYTTYAARSRAPSKVLAAVVCSQGRTVNVSPSQLAKQGLLSDNAQLLPPTVEAAQPVSAGPQQHEKPGKGAGAPQHAQHRKLSQSLLSKAAAGVLAALLSWSASAAAPAFASTLVPTTASKSYDAVVKKRGGRYKSNLPTAQQAEALLELDRDMFTQAAWEGMAKIVQYAKYLDQVHDEEEGPGCEQCTDNRLILERTWQVVANEFYDPHGELDQGKWAGALLKTLKEAGGCLHTKQETYHAAKQMVASLGDKYTEFLEPSQYRRAIRRPMPAERDYLAAQFTGTGVHIGQPAASGGWLVDAAMAESPAEEAGIKSGDAIVEIDGYPAAELTQHEVAELMRGVSGSTVILTVAPAVNPTELRTVYLERRPLPQPPLKQALLGLPDGPTVSYLRLHYFCSEGTRAFFDAVGMAEFYDVDGYIVDLRNNPGGVFEEAIAIASSLLRDNQQVAQTIRTGAIVDNTWKVGALSKEVYPNTPHLITTKPMVVLTNSSTASASEVLSGALRDNGRATLVGENTFGKGVVQYYFPMTDGSGLKVTVAKYLTPSHYDITTQGGLKPDVVCHDNPHGERVTPDNDECIRAALQLIERANPAA